MTSPPTSSLEETFAAPTLTTRVLTKGPGVTPEVATRLNHMVAAHTKAKTERKRTVVKHLGTAFNLPRPPHKWATRHGSVLIHPPIHQSSSS